MSSHSPLMDRINLVDWTQLPIEAQLDFIRKLQLGRIEALEASRKVKTSTVSAARNRAKKSGSPTKSIDKLAKLLAEMNPKQLEAFKSVIK